MGIAGVRGAVVVVVVWVKSEGRDDGLVLNM